MLDSTGSPLTAADIQTEVREHVKAEIAAALAPFAGQTFGPQIREEMAAAMTRKLAELEAWVNYCLGDLVENGRHTHSRPPR